jgi:hypothetical protein
MKQKKNESQKIMKGAKNETYTRGEQDRTDKKRKEIESDEEIEYVIGRQVVYRIAGTESMDCLSPLDTFCSANDSHILLSSVLLE